jgi:23S rRNA pseudouridine2605 synthase
MPAPKDGRINGEKMPGIRIQKVLAEAGVASRRAAEEMVTDGRVSVNGRPVTSLPLFVDPESDRIFIDGRALRRRSRQAAYLLLNKPRGVVCTSDDPQGRKKAVDLAPEIPGVRLYCVGRLDIDTTGLLILTNDGELTEYLTHARYGVPTTYVVEIAGQLSAEDIEAFKQGVYLDGRRTGGGGLKVLGKTADRSELEVTISEGRNKEIERILLKFGVKVRRMRRTAIGPITDRGLKTGACRELTPAEVKKLFKAGTVPYEKKRQDVHRGARRGRRGKKESF